MKTENSRRRALASLWKRVFQDEEEYISRFLDTAGDAGRVLARFENGQTVSMLFLLPLFLSCDGQKRPYWYLCAAATRPESRGRGEMARLIGRAQQLAVRDGIEGIALIPAEKPLFEYYRRLGFSETLYCDRIVSQPEPPAWDGSFRPVQPGQENLLAQLQDSCGAKTGVLCKPAGLYRFHLQGEGQQAFLIAEQGKTTGFLLFDPAQRRVRELWHPRAQEVLSAFAAFTGEPLACEVPGTGREKGLLWTPAGTKPSGPLFLVNLLDE